MNGKKFRSSTSGFFSALKGCSYRVLREGCEDFCPAYLTSDSGLETAVIPQEARPHRWFGVASSSGLNSFGKREVLAVLLIPGHVLKVKLSFFWKKNHISLGEDHELIMRAAYKNEFLLKGFTMYLDLLWRQPAIWLAHQTQPAFVETR